MTQNKKSDCSPPPNTLEKPDHVRIKELMIERGFSLNALASASETFKKQVEQDFQRILRMQTSHSVLATRATTTTASSRKTTAEAVKSIIQTKRIALNDLISTTKRQTVMTTMSTSTLQYEPNLFDPPATGISTIHVFC